MTSHFTDHYQNQTTTEVGWQHPKAFNDIKQIMANTSHPKPDAPTNIMTNAYNTAVGAVLCTTVD